VHNGFLPHCPVSDVAHPLTLLFSSSSALAVDSAFNDVVAEDLGPVTEVLQLPSSTTVCKLLLCPVKVKAKA